MKGICLGVLVLALYWHACMPYVIVDGYDGEENVITTPGDFSDDCWSARSMLPHYKLNVCTATGPAKEHVTIGTYNADFLFSGINPPNGCRWTDTALATQHLNDVADVIKRNDPDILNVVEVENMEMLERLEELLKPTQYFSYLIPGTDTATRQNVGLISRYKISAPSSRSDCKGVYQIPGSNCGSALTNKKTGIPKHLITLFNSCLFGKKFAIVGVQLQAIPLYANQCARREGQALVLQDILNQLIKSKFEIILMGDLNDYSDVIKDSWSHVPKSNVLAMLRDPNGDGVDELENAMNFIGNRADRYTAWWDTQQEQSMIDHILMTKELYDRISNVWVDHAYSPGTISDHWPVYVTMSTAYKPSTSRKLRWWGDLGGARRAASKTMA